MPQSFSEQLKDEAVGKTVIDTVVPLQFAKGKASALIVEEGSAAEQALVVPMKKLSRPARSLPSRTKIV